MKGKAVSSLEIQRKDFRSCLVLLLLRCLVPIPRESNFHYDAESFVVKLSLSAEILNGIKAEDMTYKTSTSSNSKQVQHSPARTHSSASH